MYSYHSGGNFGCTLCCFATTVYEENISLTTETISICGRAVFPISKLEIEVASCIDKNKKFDFPTIPIEGGASFSFFGWGCFVARMYKLISVFFPFFFSLSVRMIDLVHIKSIETYVKCNPFNF